MSALGLPILDKSVQDANRWLDELMSELGWDDKQRAYRLLRSTFHVLRDRLSVAEATDLAAQLPTFLRGVYYEGWSPSKVPSSIKTAKEFVEAIEAAFAQDPNSDARQCVEGALAVISRRVSAGEIDDVKSGLPRSIAALWP